MPGLDRTGPLGTGPAGRGMGPCNRGGIASWQRRGGRFSRGSGAGMGLRFCEVLDQERTSLEAWRDFLKLRLEWVEKRLEAFRQPEK